MKKPSEIAFLGNGKPVERFTETGLTAEGHSYVLFVDYELNAPGEADPLRITGSYGAADGGGEVLIERTDSGQYVSHDYPENPQPRPADCLPWVIADGQRD